MYPDLSYFFHDILGTQVDNWTSIFKTFGFMLVVALVACGYFLKSELVRLESEGKILPKITTVTVTGKIALSDILTNSVFFCILVAKGGIIVSDFTHFSANPAGAIFSKEGFWLPGILAGFLFSVYHIWNNSKITEKPVTRSISIYPSSKTNDIIILAGLSGVLGSKLFSVLEDIPAFLEDPSGAFFSGSGLNVYGGLILAFITVYWYVNRIGIKPIYMMDIAGMGILLGYAIGRIGCQLSGDGDWGIQATAIPDSWFLPDWLWSYTYPSNVNNEGVLLASCNPETYQNAVLSGLSTENSCVQSCGMRYCHELDQGVYPTPIYETLFCLLAFGILYMKKHAFRIPGTLFFTYMIINGFERFLIETIRVNEKYPLFGMLWSQAQYISVLFVITGFAGLVYLLKIRKS